MDLVRQSKQTVFKRFGNWSVKGLFGDSESINFSRSTAKNIIGFGEKTIKEDELLLFGKSWRRKKRVSKFRRYVGKVGFGNLDKTNNRSERSSILQSYNVFSNFGNRQKETVKKKDTVKREEETKESISKDTVNIKESKSKETVKRDTVNMKDTVDLKDETSDDLFRKTNTLIPSSEEKQPKRENTPTPSTKHNNNLFRNLTL